MPTILIHTVQFVHTPELEMIKISIPNEIKYLLVNQKVNNCIDTVILQHRAQKCLDRQKCDF